MARYTGPKSKIARRFRDPIFGEDKALVSNPDPAMSALIFAGKVLQENLIIQQHERKQMGYLEVQMIFETDNFVTDYFVGYTSYSNQLYQESSKQGNYDGFILFVGTYKNSKRASFRTR